MSTNRRIEIYDTTLRDGTQGEGFNLSLQDKLLIAQKLDELGVDYIEGGFPLSNPKDEQFFKDVRELKKLLLADQRQVARNLVQQLVAYSTGASVRFGDRAAVEQILDRTEQGGYGVRSLVKEIVASETFGMK